MTLKAEYQALKLEGDSLLTKSSKKKLVCIGVNFFENNGTSSVDEFERFKSLQKMINFSEDPLEWWKANEKAFPMMYKLAKKYLVVPPSSAAVERLFKTAKLVQDPMRASMKTGTLERKPQPHETSVILRSFL